MWIAAGHLAIAAIVGGVQCVLIWRGLDLMRRAADAWDRGLEKNQRLEADRRHAESMEATGAQSAAPAEAVAALKVVVERTVPVPGAASPAAC